jgi:hypothetical protein
MVEPTNPIPPSIPTQSVSKTLNIPLLSKQMQDEVLTLADHLKKISEDPTLTNQHSFLSKFANNVSNLNQTVNQALTLKN